MKKTFIKKLLPHLAAILLFFILALAYFPEILEGKKIEQPDIKNWAGAAKEVNDYKAQTGETSFWTNSMFGGMPTYLINNPESPNIFSFIYKVINHPSVRPVCHLILYMLGFYIALLAFGVNPWISIAGAIAYGFSSYFLIIIAAGHVTKAIALGFMPPVIAGVYLAYNRKLWVGAALMAVFLVFQLITNHLQIVYYTLIIVALVGMAEFIVAVMQKKILRFIKVSIVLVIAALFAVASNTTSLYLVYEYGKDSMRGKSELTHNQSNKTSGLDRDYATAWSYGKAETMTLLIPDFHGGESGGSLSTHSETFKDLNAKYGAPTAKRMIEQLPTYWGPQPFTSGPVYVGAIVVFLFVLGLFVVKGSLRWWVVAATCTSVLLAWGKHFMPLTDFFLDYIPGYNKFRTVSMILVIAEFTIPLLGMIALQKIISQNENPALLRKPLIYAGAITGGIIVFFLLFAGLFFDFSSPSDAQYANTWLPLDALKADRASLLKADALRSLIFVGLAFGALWLLIGKKISSTVFYVFLTVIILTDLWTINKRYLNEDNFVSARVAKKYYTPSKADDYLLKDNDPDFRVLNLSVSTFNDASTSYFHKSIGGYHGAKMKRYQELIDMHISREMKDIIAAFNSKKVEDITATLKNCHIINMLNTKYIIYNPESFPLINMNCLGNAWFVENYRFVANADEEIEAMYSFNPDSTAIIDKRFADMVGDFKPVTDATGTVSLASYKPDHLQYRFISKVPRMTVFSEIYYDKGWTATIDGIPAPVFRANYVLRAMIIPEGEHIIEFRFKPTALVWTNPVTMASSFILFIAAVVIFILALRRHFTEQA